MSEHDFWKNKKVVSVWNAVDDLPRYGSDAEPFCPLSTDEPALSVDLHQSELSSSSSSSSSPVSDAKLPLKIKIREKRPSPQRKVQQYYTDHDNRRFCSKFIHPENDIPHPGNEIPHLPFMTGISQLHNEDLNVPTAVEFWKDDCSINRSQRRRKRVLLEDDELDALEDSNHAGVPEQSPPIVIEPDANIRAEPAVSAFAIDPELLQNVSKALKTIKSLDKTTPSHPNLTPLNARLQQVADAQNPKKEDASNTGVLASNSAQPQHSEEVVVLADLPKHSERPPSSGYVSRSEKAENEVVDGERPKEKSDLLLGNANANPGSVIQAINDLTFGKTISMQQSLQLLQSHTRRNSTAATLHAVCGLMLEHEQTLLARTGSAEHALRVKLLEEYLESRRRMQAKEEERAHLTSVLANIKRGHTDDAGPQIRELLQRYFPPRHGSSVAQSDSESGHSDSSSDSSIQVLDSGLALSRKGSVRESAKGDNARSSDVSRLRKRRRSRSRSRYRRKRRRSRLRSRSRSRSRSRRSRSRSRRRGSRRRYSTRGRDLSPSPSERQVSAGNRSHSKHRTSEHRISADKSERQMRTRSRERSARRHAVCKGKIVESAVTLPRREEPTAASSRHGGGQKVHSLVLTSEKNLELNVATRKPGEVSKKPESIEPRGICVVEENDDSSEARNVRSSSAGAVTVTLMPSAKLDKNDSRSAPGSQEKRPIAEDAAFYTDHYLY